jgi:two-component system, OmpR family, osmolarity sensor histidine kinase EnvZ
MSSLHGNRPSKPTRKRRRGLSVFWRTFFLVSILLICSVLAWLQTFRSLDYEPKQLFVAQQAASLVNLSRVALKHSDTITRVSLLKSLREQENLHILPREPSDRFDVYGGSSLKRNIRSELMSRLGEDSVVAGTVNGQEGLWVGFSIDQDSYWIRMDSSRLGMTGGITWVIWALVSVFMSLVGSALIASLINRPLKDLSFAASRLREGDYGTSRLNESAMTSEIREVNAGFNRMAEQLAKVEQERAVMLAGISHDLRTPLARLRLEAEMSVKDEQAREYMSADISQLDAIIDKFLEYAKPGHAQLVPVNIQEVLKSCLSHERDKLGLHVRTNVPATICVLGDRVELSRVFTNLIENARKYGHSTDKITHLDITVNTHNDQVFIKFRDHGKGVPAAMLEQLTQPFFRGDAARTHATGAGLGLAIIEKTIARMGGAFKVSNAESGGLLCRIRLEEAHVDTSNSILQSRPE